MDIDKDAEIKELRENSYTTLRPTVDGMEKLLYKPVKVLDHGFIRLIDYMGDDSAIVQAARVSYGKGTKKVNQDRGLIHYLMRHRHTTPFEMCDIKLHIKLPIFIARQWIRHRTASINEYSGRYSVLANEFYIPSHSNLAAQSTTNMQGREELLSGDEAQKVLDILINDSRNCYNNYEEMLNEDALGNKRDENRKGLARELARMNLPTNLYTEWYWKTNLHNLLNFLSLRADSHAQYEIRVYAEAILDMVKEWVPHTYDAFMEYRINGANLSGNAVKLVKSLINGKKVSFEESGMTKREWQEVNKLLELEI